MLSNPYCLKIKLTPTLRAGLVYLNPIEGLWDHVRSISARSKYDCTQVPQSSSNHAATPPHTNVFRAPFPPWRDSKRVRRDSESYPYS